MSDLKEVMTNIVLGIVALAIVAAIVAGLWWIQREANTRYINTQVITPKPGVSCLVVTASDSTSTACWKE